MFGFQLRTEPVATSNEPARVSVVTAAVVGSVTDVTAPPTKTLVPSVASARTWPAKFGVFTTGWVFAVVRSKPATLSRLAVPT